ncbi:MAG TPA: alkaline phosphatase family protein [Bryobacteraceae bacterium]|nr:alkaline phosphatase family protein [Bryobacteraceae bacterium]
MIVMTLCTDHTSGGAAGDPTPAAQVADNDLAVGRLVDAVSHSPYWSSTAILIVEDDPQAGVDHVDGHRSTAFIVSPYTQRGQVNHTFYTQINLVRTIEGLLGLPPMNQHAMLAAPMMNAFQDTPNLTPYSVIPNQIPTASKALTLPQSILEQEKRCFIRASTGGWTTSLSTDQSIEPLTPEGKATARVLRLNQAQRVIERALLQTSGKYPRGD